MFRLTSTARLNTLPKLLTNSRRLTTSYGYQVPGIEIPSPETLPGGCGAFVSSNKALFVLKWPLSADLPWQGSSHQPHGWCWRSGREYTGNGHSLKNYNPATKTLHQHHHKNPTTWPHYTLLCPQKTKTLLVSPNTPKKPLELLLPALIWVHAPTILGLHSPAGDGTFAAGMEMSPPPQMDS